MKPYGLIDLHCDTLTDWRKGPVDGIDTLEDPARVLSLSSIPKDTHWAQFYAIYVPDHIRGADAIVYYDMNRQNFLRQMEKYGDRVMACRNISDMEAAWAAGKTAAFLSVENGSALAGQMERVALLADHGVCCMSLTWNGENEIASGNTTDHGFSDFGRAVIPALEEAGILVDVSHLNDRGFEELMGLAKKPFVATHSNARSICGHPRNLTDDMIREMVSRRCLVGLNYCTRFLADEGLVTGPEQILAHVEHFFRLGGESILALGSDFDGAALPDYLNTPEKVTKLYDFFIEKGLSRAQADGIFFENARCFFRENMK